MKYFDLGDLAVAALPRSEGSVAGFEKDFAAYVGARHATATSYGRSAIYLALRAIGVEGREVIVPSFLCSVVLQAVEAAGAVPRFLDVTADGFSYDTRELEIALAGDPAAVVLTHHFGYPAGNLEAAILVARRRGVPLIEDCAHCLGATLRGKKLGTFGDIGVFSLTKNLINLGGGVMVTGSDELHRRAQGVAAKGGLSAPRRWEDGFIHLAYGVHQFVEKGTFSRVGPKGRWMLSLPGNILKARLMVKKALSAARAATGREAASDGGVQGLTPDGQYLGLHPIRMHPRIAALARRQLRKVDPLSARRRGLIASLADHRACHSIHGGSPDVVPAGSYLVLRLKNRDLETAVHRARRGGLCLYRTWPARQVLREGQATPGLLAIRDQVLTSYLHPDLNPREVRAVRAILEEISAPGPEPGSMPFGPAVPAPGNPSSRRACAGGE